jgi:hypothetical protein
MRRSAQLTFLLGLCQVLPLALPALAGPLFRCPKAVSSSKGNFLVLSNIQVKPGPDGTLKIERFSLQVFPKENFIHVSDKTTRAATFWEDWPQWDVALDANAILKCPVPLITDNGQFLILLRIGPIFSGDEGVLQIYRWDHRYDPEIGRTPHHGVLVRDIDLKELWSPEKVAANAGTTWTDETPEWFDGGIFEFSSDNKQLIHKTRWGNTTRITLEDGSVSRR